MVDENALYNLGSAGRTLIIVGIFEQQCDNFAVSLLVVRFVRGSHDSAQSIFSKWLIQKSEAGSPASLVQR